MITPLSQTWEDPSVQDEETKLYGDRDPLDLVELGDRPIPTGTVTEVKVIGVADELWGDTLLSPDSYCVS